MKGISVNKRKEENFEEVPNSVWVENPTVEDNFLEIIILKLWEVWKIS